MASVEVETPLKMCVTVLEKKIRNLEKRKSKLDSYREKVAELDKDQQEAVAKYDSVLTNLEFARELQKQFFSINAECEKQTKRQAKRERQERQLAAVARMHSVLKMQQFAKLLRVPQVKEAFLSGKIAEASVSEEEMVMLEKLFSLLCPQDSATEQELHTCSEHLHWLLEKSDRALEPLSSSGKHTYREGSLLLEKVISASVPEALVEVAKQAATAGVVVVDADDDVGEGGGAGNNVGGAGNDVGGAGNDVGGDGKEVDEEEGKEQVVNVVNVESTARLSMPVPQLQQQQLQQQQALQPQPQQQQALQPQQQQALQPQQQLQQGWPSHIFQQQQQHLHNNHYNLLPTTTATTAATSYDNHHLENESRPLHDIVSSVQGDYNFLQESLIEQQLFEAGQDIRLPTTTTTDHPTNLLSKQQHHQQRQQHLLEHLVNKNISKNNNNNIKNDTSVGLKETFYQQQHHYHHQHPPHSQHLPHLQQQQQQHLEMETSTTVVSPLHVINLQQQHMQQDAQQQQPHRSMYNKQDSEDVAHTSSTTTTNNNDNDNNNDTFPPSSHLQPFCHQLGADDDNFQQYFYPPQCPNEQQQLAKSAMNPNAHVFQSASHNGPNISHNDPPTSRPSQATSDDAGVVQKSSGADDSSRGGGGTDSSSGGGGGDGSSSNIKFADKLKAGFQGATKGRVTNPSNNHHHQQPPLPPPHYNRFSRPRAFDRPGWVYRQMGSRYAGGASLRGNNYYNNHTAVAAGAGAAGGGGVQQASKEAAATN